MCTLNRKNVYFYCKMKVKTDQIRKSNGCTCTHSFLWTFPGAVWLLFLLVCSGLLPSSVSWWALLQTSADESQHKKEHEQRAADFCLRGEATHSHIRRWSTAHRGRRENCLPATTVTIIYSLGLGTGCCHTDYKLRSGGY